MVGLKKCFQAMNVLHYVALCCTVLLPKELPHGDECLAACCTALHLKEVTHERECVALCCRVLHLKKVPHGNQCVALCCRMLQSTPWRRVHCTVLHFVVLCCTVLQLQRATVCCDVLHLKRFHASERARAGADIVALCRCMCCSVLQCDATCFSVSHLNEAPYAFVARLE